MVTACAVRQMVSSQMEELRFLTTLVRTFDCGLSTNAEDLYLKDLLSHEAILVTNTPIDVSCYIYSFVSLSVFELAG
jgi:hypothetical protein